MLDLSLSPTLSFCNNMIMTSNEFEFYPQLTPKMKIFKHIYIKYLENTYNTTSMVFFFKRQINPSILTPKKIKYDKTLKITHSKITRQYHRNTTQACYSFNKVNLKGVSPFTEFFPLKKQFIA